MSVPRTLFSLFVFGSLGVTAITVSSLHPAGSAPAAKPSTASVTSVSGDARDYLADLTNDFRQGSSFIDFTDSEAMAECTGRSFSQYVRPLFQNPARSIQPERVSAAPKPGEPEHALVLAHEPALIDPDAAAVGSSAEWSKHTLAQGEHLAALWGSSWGLHLPTLFRLGNDPENARLLDVVHPGQEIEWQVDPDGRLKRLRLWIDRAHGYEWVRLDGTEQFTRMEISNEREIRRELLLGEVRRTLLESLADNANLTDMSAHAIAGLLDDHLPLGEEIRAGDRYALLVEIETLAGDPTPYDIRVLAFTFNGSTQAWAAVRNTDGRFYTPGGRPLLPPFDRRPFKGHYRITSGFDHGRRHPVTGRVGPHNGTDFSMPAGTPIVTPANGRVGKVENHSLAGKFVEIDHGQGFTTRYLHLQEALVEPGQLVTRGERIALSGNSGRTTSAHLHYELHVDGRPVDPMRVDLPRGEPLTDAALALFQRQALPLLTELGEAGAAHQLAMQLIPVTGP